MILCTIELIRVEIQFLSKSYSFFPQKVLFQKIKIPDIKVR